MHAQKRRGVFVPKQPDRRFVPVLEALRDRIERGEEKWGELHRFPGLPTEDEARDAARGLYRARLKTGLSVQSGYDQLTDGTWSVRVRIWSRELGKAEITRRVEAGEPLAFNYKRSQV